MILALDCETSKKPTFKPWQKEAYLSTVATLTNTNETTFTVFHHNEQSEQDWITDKCKASNLQQLLDSAECVVGSNLKFDLLWLRHIGIKYDKIRLFDTQVAEYLLTYHSNKDLGLDALARKYIGSSKLDIVRTQYWDADVNTADVPLDILRTYNVDDCKLSLSIAEKQRVLLQEKGMMKVFSVEMEKLKLLADIEYNGMKIDVDELTRQKKENYEALARCEHRIQEIIGLQFNIESNDQLSVALFGGTYYTEGSEEVSRTLKNGTIKKYTRKCDIPVEFKGYGFIPEKSWAASKEGFYHTSKDVLSLLKHQCKSKESKELVALLVERSAISQRIKTFLDGLEGRLEDGVLHPTMNNTVTATGRLSCSNPNLQNIPRGSSSDIKKFFVSKKGRLVSCDASQLEWRIAAFLSQCPIMLYEIENGIDQHAATGQDIFGGKGERTDWKIFNFRMIYGGSGFSYYMDYKMPSFSLGKWNTIVDNFYEKYYGLKKWHDSQVNNVRKNKGWIANPSGRRFRFHKNVTSSGLDYSRPQILNYPVQSFATADIMSLAMVVIDRRIRKAGYSAEIVNQIHDDILYDATEEDAPKVAKCMAQVMDELPQLIFKQYGIRFNTRLGGEAKTGLNWKNMEKMKND